MKRSEALEKLIKIHNKIFTYEMYEHYTEAELCDKLLTAIENELDMVPEYIEGIGNFWEGE